MAELKKNKKSKKAIKSKSSSIDSKLSNTKNSQIIWGGRFSDKPSDLMQEINQSIDFDKNLYRQDISGSIAHAKMLAKINILSENEKNLIISGLKTIHQEIDENKFNFRIELEDIHMNIESRLQQLIGDVAGKLHTARSRNDQVALDLRLYVRDSIDEILKIIKQLQTNLILKSKKNIDTFLPGFTHLQIAQPVSLAHHFLAYFEMFKRDISRLKDLRVRMNQCPLGSCALAGTSFPIDREFVAKELGFDQPSFNSMDSVSDRDFAIEFLFCLSMIASHLSRICEEFILWSSKGFAFINISDKYTSGSSIMPQKRNPDACELIRGKTGRIYGALFNLLTIVKSLPLTYSKDLQEDKEPVFDAVKNIKLGLEVLSEIICDVKINQENMLAMASQDFSCATDLADWLVKNLKIPFRKAHHITGSIIKFIEQKNLNKSVDQKIDLHQISLKDLQKFEPRITDDIYNFLQVKNSVKSRTSYGGTSPQEVKKQLIDAQKFLLKI